MSYASKVIVFLLALPLTLAFQTAFRSVKKSSAIHAKSKSVPFLEEPTQLAGLPGYKGFDPLGFSNFIDPKFLAEAEIKHGRVAMLGFLGFVATDFIHLPGSIHEVSAVAAHNAAVSSGAMAQILALVVALEFISVVAVKEMLDGGSRAPGEYGFDPLSFSNGKSASVQQDLKAKEIENGRAAMLAFGGIVTQAVVTGHGFPYY